MTEIYRSYKPHQYGIYGTAQVATDFYALEKAAKISYRTIDFVGLLKGVLPAPCILLSSQIKDLVLVIESTRFFCVSYPLFSSDENGRSFFDVRTKVQSAETISLTIHLALKTFYGADRVGLLRLGIIGTYAIGYMTVFRWVVEGTILLYNFFGCWDGMNGLAAVKGKVGLVQNEIEKWNERLMKIDHACKSSGMADKWLRGITDKQRKWEVVKNNLHLEQTKAWLKITAAVSKLILIIFAVSCAALNIATPFCLMTILSLGIISDAICLIRFFHQKLCKAE